MSDPFDSKPAGPALSATAGMPESLSELLDLGARLAKEKRWSAALSVALRVKALAPNDAAAATIAGYACFALGRDAEAIEHLARALAHDDHQSGLWYRRSVSLLRLGRAAEAYAHAERACALAPDRPEYHWQRRAAGARAVPDWHFNMVNDEPRNAAFAAAIAHHVKPEHRVLEIGTGSGLLAMLAARDEDGQPRARQVVTCESNPLLARTAREIIHENGLADRVQVLAQHSTEIEVGRELSGRADLLVCEIFSVQVLAEGVLPTIEDAKARLLAPGAAIIPAVAVARAALVASDALGRRVRAGRVRGFDLSRLNAFVPVVQYLSAHESVELLSPAFDLFRFDFAAHAAFPAEKRVISVEASRDGACQGVIQWLRLELAPGIDYENRPGIPESEPSRHWQPVFYPFPEPLTLRNGERVTLRASHNRSGMHVEFVSVAAR